jgi:hypothetical protein
MYSTLFNSLLPVSWTSVALVILLVALLGFLYVVFEPYRLARKYTSAGIAAMPFIPIWGSLSHMSQVWRHQYCLVFRFIVAKEQHRATPNGYKEMYPSMIQKLGGARTFIYFFGPQVPASLPTFNRMPRILLRCSFGFSLVTWRTRKLCL